MTPKRAAFRAIASIAALVAASSVPAAAQEANPLADRENRVPPVVTFLQGQGVKLTFLGEEGGLRGYLGEAANGSMQTFYVTPDGRHVVAGILFRQGGDNVTGVQIGEMRARFDAASQSLGLATIEGHSAETSPEPAPEPEIPAIDPLPEAGADIEELFQQAPAAEDHPGDGPSGTEAPASERPETAEPASGGLTLPPATGQVEGMSGNPSELWLSDIDRDTFVSMAESAPFFEVGSRTAPSVLWMVADPQCPYCHRAWEHVRQKVYDRQMRVRIIMIAGLPGSEPIAREMLAHAQPARKWLETEGGRLMSGEGFTPSVPSDSQEWSDAGGYLASNMDFARRFGVDRTPFLGYVADGRLYTALGLPGDLDAFLEALTKH